MEIKKIIVGMGLSASVYLGTLPELISKGIPDKSEKTTSIQEETSYNTRNILIGYEESMNMIPGDISLITDNIKNASNLAITWPVYPEAEGYILKINGIEVAMVLTPSYYFDEKELKDGLNIISYTAFKGDNKSPESSIEINKNIINNNIINNNNNNNNNNPLELANDNVLI